MGILTGSDSSLLVVKAAFSDSAADQAPTVINTWQNLLMADGTTAVSVTIAQTATYLPLLYLAAVPTAASVVLELRALRVSDSLVIGHYRIASGPSATAFAATGSANIPVALTEGDVIRVQISSSSTNAFPFKRPGCGITLTRVKS